MFRGVGGVVQECWDRLVASDPGLSRLLFAGRGAGSLASALAVEYGVATLLGATGFSLLFYLFMGGIVGMMGGMAMSGGNSGVWVKVRTTFFFPVAVGAGLTIGALAHSSLVLELAVFVVMTFAAVFVRRFGASFFFYGFMGWIGYLFAALLGASFAMLPTLIVALAIGAGWVLLLSLTVLRANNARALRRTLRAFQARVRTVAAVCVDLADVTVADERALSRWRKRLHRQQSRLTEAALMIEASSGEPRALPDADTGERLRGYALQAQLAIDALAGSIEAIAVGQPQFAREAAAVGGSVSRRDYRGAAQSAEALRRSVAERPELEAGGWWPFSRLSESVSEFTALTEQASDSSPAGVARAIGPERSEGADGGGFRAAVGLMMGNLPGSTAVAGQVSPRGPRWKLLDKLDMPTRQALQVGLASALAIIAGYAVSDYRYYWALIAVFVTFTGTATRAESARKAIYRVVGTLVGLFVAIFLAGVTAGNVWLVLVVIVGCMFCGFYLIRISYAIMIFFITIMVAQLYSVLGEFSDGLLYLRLEETAIGAVIGIAVAMLFLPLSTGDTVRTARNTVLSALADALCAIAERIGGPPTIVASRSGDDTNGNDEDGQHPRDLEALARSLDNQVRLLGQVATPFARPAMWGDNGRHIRYRLARFSAIAAHVRTITVALRRHAPTGEAALAELCRSLAEIAAGLAGTPPSENSAERHGPAESEVAPQRRDRIGEHLRIRLPDTGPPRHYPIIRSLVQINDLLDEIAAAIPPGRSQQSGTSQETLPPKTETDVERRSPQGPAAATAATPAVAAAGQWMLTGAVHAGTTYAASGEPLGGAVVLLTDTTGHRPHEREPARTAATS
jgi:MFS family permease